VARERLASLAEAASLVADGAKIGFGGSTGLFRRPVAFAGELARQGRRGLHVCGVISGIEADLLIGTGAVAELSTSYVGFDDLGQSPHFQRAAAAGELAVNEYSEWLVTAAFRAANMALPFIPWPTARHNDLVADLGLVEIECPYTGTPLLAVRALELDVAVIQAVRCDREGNAEEASPKDFIYDVDALVARAAKTVIVCAEEIGEVDPDRVQLIGREVDAVVHLPRGSAPGGLHPLYGADRAHLRDVYLPAAREGRFTEYLESHVFAAAA
jgi:glutaconate CoA-transferase subunit A